MMMGKSDLEKDAETAMARAEGLLRYDGDSPHVEPMDDLSRHRLMDAILRKADAAQDVPTPNTSIPWIAGRSLWFPALGVAAAAAALLLAGAFLFLLTGEKPRGNTANKPGSVLAIASGARVMMISGLARVNASEAHAGATLSPGQRIAIESGHAVLALPTGISLVLKDQARLRMDRTAGDEIQVSLERGTLLASVLPGRKGPLFSVATPKGKVTVTGTVFSIAATAGTVELQVLRGAVRVNEPGRISRKVGLSTKTMLGSGADDALSETDESAGREALAMLEMLADGDGALLSVESVPSGAQVAVEGMVIGATPLSAVFRPGHRNLDLTLAGHAPVRERLELAQGAVVSRVFELQPVDKPEVGTGAAKDRPVPIAIAHETARDLLVRAQALRALRNWSGAAEAYQRLTRQYSASAEAHSALVSLGLIQLDHLGQPQAALQRFERYLSESPKGSLAPEAAFGRARALGVLGRTQAEIAALGDFIQRYPGAVQAPEAKQRLENIDRP